MGKKSKNGGGGGGEKKATTTTEVVLTVAMHCKCKGCKDKIRNGVKELALVPGTTLLHYTRLIDRLIDC